jgi:hypothetical protein
MSDQKKQRCARCHSQYHTDCTDPKDEREKFDLLRRKWERTPMPNGENADPPQILYWVIAGLVSWVVVVFILTLLVLSFTNKT